MLYYLFLQSGETSQIFQELSNQPEQQGIKYICVKSNIILQKCIFIESIIYSDAAIKNIISQQLSNVGYTNPFQILKPLTTSEII